MSRDILFRRALDFIDATSGVDDPAQIRKALLGAIKKFGLRSFIVCDLPQPGQDLAIHLCDFPEGFIDHYVSHEHHASDPLARHARQTTEPFLWSEVQWDRARGSAAQHVMDVRAAYGLYEGFVVSIVGVHGEHSAIGLSGPRLTLRPDERGMLHLMCVYAHHAARVRNGKLMTLVNARLTGLEQDCILWGGLNAKAEAIGDRLRLRAGEVHAAVRSACRKLGVLSLADAVALAILQGKIAF